MTTDFFQKHMKLRIIVEKQSTRHVHLITNPKSRNCFWFQIKGYSQVKLHQCKSVRELGSTIFVYLPINKWVNKLKYIGLIYIQPCITAEVMMSEQHLYLMLVEWRRFEKKKKHFSTNLHLHKEIYIQQSLIINKI